VAVALGGYPAYKIYILHEADAGRLMEKYSFLKTAHRFLRNRFYIDAFYYKVASSARFFSQKLHNSLEYGLNVLNSFTASRVLSLARITHKYVETEGITKPQIMGFRNFLDTAYRGMAMLSQLAYPRLELGGLESFNRLIAKTVTNLSKKFRKIQSGVLSYNILAVFAGFILLAILLLLFGGGF
jgi:hypothetical protein